MDVFGVRSVASAYDTAADAYTARYGDDLAQLIVDREILDLAMDGRTVGPVLEVGSGPAPAAAYLAGTGARFVAFDVSPQMLRIVRQRVPASEPVQGDVRALPFADASFAVVIVFYVLQHVRRDQLGPALAEVARVVMPDGAVALATHLGSGGAVVDELAGVGVPPFGGTFYQPDEVVGPLGNAGLEVERQVERDALEHEYPSRRLYLVARKGAVTGMLDEAKA